MVLCDEQLCADVFAKESEAENLYGKGVHAFFDTDYAGAIKLLTKVEELGCEDPRPYFFLGLAQYRLKQKDVAKETFKKAAELEWTGRAAKDFNVSDALKRIQGKERLHVESFRRQAKADWEKADKSRQQERYGQERLDGKAILAKLSKGSELPQPKQESAGGIAPFGAKSIDPFNVSKAKEEPKTSLPQSKKQEVDEDPFGPSAEEEKPEEPEESPVMSVEEEDDDNKAEEPKKEEKKEEKEEEKKDDDDPFK
jgi:tetratricopeptide (TPR) repeat protein